MLELHVITSIEVYGLSNSPSPSGPGHWDLGLVSSRACAWAAACILSFTMFADVAMQQ